MNLKEALWPRSKYMDQLGIKMKAQDLSEKECLVQEYTVDLGNPLDKKIVYVKTPMRLEDFDFEEEEKNIMIPTECCVDRLGLDMNGLMKKSKELITTGSTGISWKETFIKEEKNMPSAVIPYCDEICEYLGLTTKTPDNKPKWIEGLPAVKKVETYNDRVVKVTFIDGTFTKAVCSENDNFDLDMGITICSMKRLLGTNSDNATREYNRFINHVHSVMEKNSLEEVAEEARQAKEKSRKRKAELKRAAKKLKAKEEAIDIQKQAIIRAHQEMGAMDQ